MLDIPDEIWEEVGRFLPPEILRNLYPVNSAFFNLVMDERYRHVDIGLNWRDINEGIKTLNLWRYLEFGRPWCHSPDAIRFSTRDQLALIVPRVRHLTIRTYWLQKLLSVPPLGSNFMNSLAYYLDLYLDYDLYLYLDLELSGDPSIQRIAQHKHFHLLLKAVVSSFTNVSKITIDCGFTYPHPMSFLINSYPALSSTLRQLSLHAEPAHIRSLLPLGSSNPLPLEEISLVFGRCNPPDHNHLENISELSDPKEAAAFLSSTCKTIHTLDLTFHSPIQVYIEARTFFDSLPHFPKLRSFSLLIPTVPNCSRLVTSEDTAPAVSFLNKHTRTLRRIVIQPPAPSPLAPFRSNNLAPRLADLDALTLLSPPRTGMNAPRLAPWAARMLTRGSEETLTSLLLFHGCMSLKDLGQLLNNVGRRLKVLGVEVLDLCPGLFDVVAEKARNVIKLTVHFTWVKGDGGVLETRNPWRDSRQEDIGPFLRSIKTRIYPDFKLSSLVIARHEKHLEFSTGMRILKGIKGSVPSLSEISVEISLWRETMRWDAVRALWVVVPSTQRLEPR